MNRNILVLGRTGSGKTTLARVLTGERVKADSTPAPLPESQVLQTLTKAYKYGSVLFKYNVLDTVGFSDLDRNNASIMAEIYDMARTSFVSFHHVFYVVKLGRIDDQIVREIKEVTRFFGSRITLVFTHCPSSVSVTPYLDGLARYVPELIVVTKNRGNYVGVDLLNEQELALQKIAEYISRKQQTNAIAVNKVTFGRVVMEERKMMGILFCLVALLLVVIIILALVMASSSCHTSHGGSKPTATANDYGGLSVARTRF